MTAGLAATRFCRSSMSAMRSPNARSTCLRWVMSAQEPTISDAAPVSSRTTRNVSWIQT